MFPAVPWSRRVAVVAILALGIAALFLVIGRSRSAALTHGADISWPNCPRGEGIPSRRSQGEPMPTASARFVIVGLTNGPGFHPNPCLVDQVGWATSRGRQLGAYAMTTYPTRSQLRAYGGAGPYRGTGRSARLANAGYAEATYNVVSMADAGMAVPMVWVDVEPYPVAPWRHSHAANRAVIRSAVRSYRAHGYHVGLYTYARGWRQVVGSWRLRSYPTWVPALHHSARAAAHACTRGPSGGRTWITQWTRHSRDHDLICPAAAHRVYRAFS